jgi:hypothetical protein
LTITFGTDDEQRRCYLGDAAGHLDIDFDPSSNAETARAIVTLDRVTEA